LTQKINKTFVSTFKAFFCDFTLIARFGKRHATSSSIGCTPHTYHFRSICPC